MTTRCVPPVASRARSNSSSSAASRFTANTDGVKGLCLDPHDLAIAKYAAFREKDLVFTRELARRGLLSEEKLLARLEQTPIDAQLRERIRNQIARDFAP